MHLLARDRYRKLLRILLQLVNLVNSQTMTYVPITATEQEGVKDVMHVYPYRDGKGADGHGL